MKKMYNAYEHGEAYIVKGILESHGIKAEVQDDMLNNLVGGTAYAEVAISSIWIFDDSKYDEAYKILEEYVRKKSEKVSNEVVWICKNCKEESTEAFTECWNCGESR